jgi:hypothetical protein
MNEKLEQLTNLAKHYTDEIKKQKKELEDYRKSCKRRN